MRLLIISGQDALTSRIGNTYSVEKTIQSYMKSKSANFLCEFVYYDRKNKFNVAPVKKRASSIRKFIHNIEQKWGLIDFLLLFGGHEIIPFFSLENPCNDDDAVVYSDNPYASRDKDHEIPERSCARIPDNCSAEFIIKQLQKIPSRNKRAFGISAQVWDRASQRVYGTIGKIADLKLSPPVKSATFAKNWLQQKDYLYFNLHGSKVSAHWYGQKGQDYPVALSIDRIKDPAGIIAAECCYGAYILKKNHLDSLALNFLNYSTVYGFCGATTIAYGPAVPPSSEADLLVQYFFEYTNQGLTIGESFKNAKNDFARSVLRTQGFLDEDDRKTLLQFVLYGDPTVRMTQ